jgi:hypothetical protein
MEIATRIISSFMKDYGSETNYLETEGKILDQEETEKHISEYLSYLGL